MPILANFAFEFVTCGDNTLNTADDFTDKFKEQMV